MATTTKTAKVQETIKNITGHPKLNMIILGAASGLMTFSALSGFISYGKLGSELSSTKKLLLGASLMSLFSAILLGVGIFLVHQHIKKMEAVFKGFFSLTLLGLAGLFMLISGIMYAAAAAKLNSTDSSTGKKYRDTYGTSFTTAVLSAVMTLGGLGAVGLSFLFALLGKKKTAPPPPHIAPKQVTTKVDLEAPKYNAMDVLRQLEIGSGVTSASGGTSETGGQ
jgi:hypothetical protein